MIDLNRDWLADHPLPLHGEGTDKNSRGRVLLAGGARFVPGALRLTGEAALRAGAGKLQMATVADVAMHVGVLVPEAAMIALPTGDDGEIGGDAVPVIEQALENCDAFILGPGMSEMRSRRRSSPHSWRGRATDCRSFWTPPPSAYVPTSSIGFAHMAAAS